MNKDFSWSVEFKDFPTCLTEQGVQPLTFHVTTNSGRDNEHLKVKDIEQRMEEDTIYYDVTIEYDNEGLRRLQEWNDIQAYMKGKKNEQIR